MHTLTYMQRGNLDFFFLYIYKIYTYTPDELFKKKKEREKNVLCAKLYIQREKKKLRAVENVLVFNTC